MPLKNDKAKLGMTQAVAPLHPPRATVRMSGPTFTAPQRAMSSHFVSQAVPVSSSVWVVYALGAATVVYAVFLRPMMRQKKKDPLSRTPSTSTSLAQQRAVERQMETLLVELAGIAHQITAQLDTRAGKLEALPEGS